MAILPFQRLAFVRCPTHESSQIVSLMLAALGRGPAERLAGFSGSMAAAIPP